MLVNGCVYVRVCACVYVCNCVGECVHTCVSLAFEGSLTLTLGTFLNRTEQLFGLYFQRTRLDNALCIDVMGWVGTDV